MVQTVAFPLSPPWIIGDCAKTKLNLASNSMVQTFRDGSWQALCALIKTMPDDNEKLLLLEKARHVRLFQQRDPGSFSETLQSNSDVIVAIDQMMSDIKAPKNKF